MHKHVDYNDMKDYSFLKMLTSNNNIETICSQYHTHNNKIEYNSIFPTSWLLGNIPEAIMAPLVLRVFVIPKIYFIASIANISSLLLMIEIAISL